MSSEDPGAAQPRTKAARQALIVQILGKEPIRSQAELRAALAERGVSTTQATLSRDLVELRATKVRSSTGSQVYAVPQAGAPGQVHAGIADDRARDLDQHVTSRLARWCTDLLVTAESAGSLVVLRTPAGAAQLLASALDEAMLPGVLGCVGGDDTVLVITREEPIASRLTSRLLCLADPAQRR